MNVTTSPDKPGPTFYALNNSDHLESDAQVDQLLAELESVKPSAFMISEACSTRRGLAPGAEKRFFQGLSAMGYGFEALTAPYTEVAPDGKRRDDEHNFVAGARIELGAQLDVVTFAGRGAVHMAFLDPRTGRRIDAIGVHANDDPDRRAAEFDSLVEHYRTHYGGDAPFVVFGDKNNAVDSTIFGHGLRFMGRIAKFVVSKGWVDMPELGERVTSLKTRLASLAIRGAARVDGAQILKLRSANLRDADTRNLPTALVPALPERFTMLLRLIPRLGAWLLDEPHLQLDHIMGSSAGSFVSFERRPVLPGGDHAGIVATYRLN